MSRSTDSYVCIYLSIYLYGKTILKIQHAGLANILHLITIRYLTSDNLSILLPVYLSIYLHGKSIFKIQHAGLANILYLSTSRYLTSDNLSILLPVYLSIYLHEKSIFKIHMHVWQTFYILQIHD